MSDFSAFLVIMSGKYLILQDFYMKLFKTVFSLCSVKLE